MNLMLALELGLPWDNFAAFVHAHAHICDDGQSMHLSLCCTGLRLLFVFDPTV